MQTLWARVASRGACRCPQCLHVPSGVTRRTTANATNSVPRYWTSSTLWLSGTFATAATFDAVAKKHRREQWDAAIAEIKQELGNPEQRHQHDKPDEPLTLTNPLLDVDLDIFRFVRPDRAAASWPDSASLAVQEYRLSPQSIYAAARRKGDASQRHWTPKKLEMMMLSMDILQLTILIDLNLRGLSNGAIAAVPQQYAKVIQMPREQLQSMQQSKIAHLKYVQKSLSADLGLGYQRPPSDMPLCRYSEDENGDYRRVTQDLNLALQGLFDSYFGETISKSVLLARLAYNLSLSSAAPNIDTYNTLLIGFSRSHPQLVKATIQSLNSTRVRPNEITDETMLKFYTQRNERKFFIRYLETMRGKHGGQCLARPDITVNKAGKSRLIASDKQPNKIIQLPYPTPKVFAAVVEGLLKFGRFDTALTICQQMESDGWAICMRGLFPMLRDCVDKKNWNAGLAVWNQVHALQNPSARQIGHGPMGIQIYALMLRLCRQCREQETYDAVWTDATRRRGIKAESLMEILGNEIESPVKTLDKDSGGVTTLLVDDPESTSVPTSLNSVSAPQEASDVRASTKEDSRAVVSAPQRQILPRSGKTIVRSPIVISAQPSFPHLWHSEGGSWQHDARPA